jgi:hypothetical protein
MAVASPCINVCRMDEHSALCVGCFRTLDEIAGWSTCSDAQRIEVLARVEKRRADYDPNGAALRGECVREEGKNDR